MRGDFGVGIWGERMELTYLGRAFASRSRGLIAWPVEGLLSACHAWFECRGGDVGSRSRRGLRGRGGDLAVVGPR